jgi:hypothetical protein
MQSALTSIELAGHRAVVYDAKQDILSLCGMRLLPIHLLNPRFPPVA